MKNFFLNNSLTIAVVLFIGVLIGFIIYTLHEFSKMWSSNPNNVPVNSVQHWFIGGIFFIIVLFCLVIYIIRKILLNNRNSFVPFQFSSNLRMI